MLEIDYKAKKCGKDQMPHITSHDTEILSIRAKLAINFAERWGMVAATPDGEDTAGRQKLRMATTEEVSSRACDMVTAMFAEFEKREWVVQMPTMAELIEKYPSTENEDD